MPDYSKQTRSYDRDKLPYSETAEKYLIGAMMLSSEALAKISSSLRVGDFYLSKHQTIYTAILSIPLDPDKRTKTVDLQVTAERLEDMQRLEEIGGADYLSECADSYISPSTLDFNIETVNNKAVLRQMIETMRDIDYEIATEDIDNVPKYIGECETRFKNSISRRKVSSFEKTGLITEEVRQQIEMLSERGTGNEEEDAVVGVTTGFKKLNAITSGFKNGEVTIVGARPSVGKTALALNFAYNAATQGGKSVAFFSLEMNKTELVKRLVSSVSFVSLSSFNAPRYLKREDRVNLRRGLDEVAQAPIYIDDTPGITMIDIENKLRILKESDPNLGLVVIDYLNLIGGSEDRKAESRQEEVRQNSLAIKNLARSLDLPIVLLSQLNRGVDERGKNHKPQLSDLRESGAIEQDADVVMLIYRADYYRDTKVDTNKKRSEMSEEEIFLANQQEKQNAGDTTGGIDNPTSYVEVDVCKNRNGPTGVASLFFQKNIQRFETPNQQWEDLVKKYRSEGYPEN
ncbi:MAG: replicative DNA helicase [Coprobacillus sp.]|nr:replicative DNA helicase [Coprobacillus sp.]